MDLSAITEAVGTPTLAWLVILFGGVVFWAFRPRIKSRAKAEDDDTG